MPGKERETLVQASYRYKDGSFACQWWQTFEPSSTFFHDHVSLDATLSHAELYQGNSTAKSATLVAPEQTAVAWAEPHSHASYSCIKARK